MTPEEHARQWWGSDDYPHREDFDALVEQFRQARAEALEEVAQLFDDDDYFIAKEIAKKIRALKEKK